MGFYHCPCHGTLSLTMSWDFYHCQCIGTLSLTKSWDFYHCQCNGTLSLTKSWDFIIVNIADYSILNKIYKIFVYNNNACIEHF